MRNILLTSTICFLAACGGDSKPVGTPSASDAALIHEQVEKANAIAAKHGYAPITSPIVEVVESDARCSADSFMLLQQVTPGTNYDNGPYDNDDRLGFVAICVAGRFIEPDKIQITEGAIRGGYGVWFEMEHAILYQRDRSRYIATMYHTPATAHPILGE